MTAQILDGKKVASEIKAKLAAEITQRREQGNAAPGLAVVLLGSDLASQVYVKNKRKSCEKIGMKSFGYDLPENTSQEELLYLINQLNRNPEVHGILVQLPLPDHIDTNFIVEAISPQKDVDGFHPYNLGRLAQRRPLLRPCTPFGIINLLKFYDIPLKGIDAVIIGASNLVGRPMGLELLLEGSSVATCHRFSKDISHYIKYADLLIVATGKRDIVNSDWIKPGAIVVDVGIHRLKDGGLSGDLDFDTAKEKASWITPVPGGVGPMTVITLLENTLKAAKKYT